MPEPAPPENSHQAHHHHLSQESKKVQSKEVQVAPLTPFTALVWWNAGIYLLLWTALLLFTWRVQPQLQELVNQELNLPTPLQQFPALKLFQSGALAWLIWPLLLPGLGLLWLARNRTSQPFNVFKTDFPGLLCNMGLGALCIALFGTAMILYLSFIPVQRGAAP